MGDINQRLFLTRSAPQVAGPVLEVGSRDYGSTESFRAIYPDYLGVDLTAGPNVDRVLDLAESTHDLPEAGFALIICCSVLEHVRRPWLMAENLTRLLRPGGHIYVAVPWVWRFHGYPDDYYRFSWRGIEELFPSIKWTKREFSTTVPDEFFPVGQRVDDALRQYAPTPTGKRKYLPYLQIHMLGQRATAP